MNGDITKQIQARLFALQDESYRAFQARLMPGVAPERIIGVRTPALRALAKELSEKADTDEFLSALPHRYYDEYNLHGFLISGLKDFEKAVAAVDRFLPYVDNWATCDLLSPKVFYRHHGQLAEEIERWAASEHTFTIRFGIEMIQTHFLDEDFDPKWLTFTAGIHSEEYYINMMIAWFFTTALTKQWDAALPFLESAQLSRWTHNKTIQKAIESRCLSQEQKQYLRALKQR